MTTKTTTTPLSYELKQAQALCDLCCQHDGCSLTFPQDAVWYGFVKTKKDDLAAISCLYQQEDDLFLFCAFTSPSFRRQGLFSSLLSLALSWLEEHFENADIEFLIDTSCKASILTAKSLEAESWYDDFQMSLSLTELPCPSSIPLPTLPRDCHFCTAQADSSLSPLLHTSWDQTDCIPSLEPASSCAIALCIQGSPVSAAFLTATSKDTIWLHSLKTLTPYRNRHFAFFLLQSAILSLKKGQASQLMLHVSSDNLPAVTLYKKTGFQIIKTLSHYLY